MVRHYARLIVAALCLFAGAAQAACSGSSPTWTAADASRTEVAACVTAASSGDTINVPSGSATWTSGIAIPAAKDLTIIGAGVDKTTITYTGNCFSIGVNDGTSSASRISGFTFVNCMIDLTGLNPAKAFRIDNNKFQSTSQRELVVSGYNYNLPPQGLIDSNTFQKTRFVVYGTAYQLAEADWQHQIWAQDPDFGGPQAVYIEDNTVDNEHPGTLDANYGGRYVYRFNTVTTTDTYATEFHGVQGDNRAPQRWEIYGNTFNVNAAIWTTSYLRGATGYYFDNTVDSDFSSGAVLKIERSCELKSPYGYCDGTWEIDGNESGKQGYPCRDQIGRSRDSVAYSGSGAWPSQALTPAYAWNNLKGGSLVGFAGYEGCTRESTLHSLENRDWYNQAASFNGTVGVGRGTIASRPATCTTGVGYWATDEGTWNANHAGNDGRLYKCTATDTWTLLYTPYTYPHPLRGTSLLPGPGNPRWRPAWLDWMRQTYAYALR